MTIKDWIKKEQEPRKISLWGTVVETDFVPELCSTIDGDGQQLIYFGTVNQRPRYWLMQIDSKHDIEDPDFNVEKIVITTLEKEFGSGEWMSEKEFDTLKSKNDKEVEWYKNHEEWLDENYRYPRLQIDGYYWGLIVNVVTGKTG